MDVQVTRVTAADTDSDLLLVEGLVDEVPVQASGWVTAMTNFYPPEAYIQGDDGGLVLVDAATARPMTDSEKMVYWQSLLAAVAPAPEVAPEPVVLFEIPPDSPVEP